MKINFDNNKNTHKKIVRNSEIRQKFCKKFLTLLVFNFF